MRTFGFLIASFCVPFAMVAAPFLDDEAGIAPMPRTSGQVKSVEITGGEPKVKLATRVGGKVDQADLRRDLQTLWATGLFLDIRVQITEASDGTAVVFEGKPKAALYLRELRMEPHSFGMQPSLTAGTPIDPLRANQVAGQVRRKLVERGYVDATVEPELVPIGKDKVDLKLHVTAGDPVRISNVEVAGDTVFDSKEVLKALQALRVTKVIPGIPGIWHGYTMRPAYSEEAVQSDLARLQSFYLARGYFDARVTVDHSEVDGAAANVRLFVSAGPHYQVKQLQISGKGIETQTETPKDGIFQPRVFCDCLMKARREAELKGIVDFSAKLSFHPLERLPGRDAVADLNAEVEEGRAYSIGRIELKGTRHYSEANIRRNLLLNETDVLDQTLLRKSIARLNQTQMFEPLEETQVAINTDEASGIADIVIPLREKKRGVWNFSGPVGPISFAGPLQFMIASRLPPWGRGIFELSTYYLSFSLIGYAHPIAAFLPMAFNNRGLLPVLSIFRPYTPGEGWKSGILIAPQLGWQASVYSYATTQITSRLMPLVVGNSRYVSALPVTFERSGGDGVLLCDPPKPKYQKARMGAAFLLQFAASVPGSL